MSTAKHHQTNKRLTAVRQALLSIFEKNHEPASVPTLLHELKRKKITANKTTVYRQLESLLQQGAVTEVRIGDRAKQYELVDNASHHHHLVCIRCKKVEDVHLPEELERQEKNIWKNKKFKVLQHNLEFFGLCWRCQRKK